MTESYFGNTGERADDAKGTFGSVTRGPAIEVSPGVRIRAIPGNNLMLSYVTIDAHSSAAVHTHSEEQMGLVLSGSCAFSLDGDEKDLKEGDTYHAPPGVPHGVRTGDESCVILDVFSPPRAALLSLIESAQ